MSQRWMIFTNQESLWSKQNKTDSEYNYLNMLYYNAAELYLNVDSRD